MEWNVREQGPRAVIETGQADDGKGLYKAYAVGPGGRFLLGTLMPEGGRLFLRRTLTIDSLKRQGVWPIQRVETNLACPFQKSTPQEPELSWDDEVLRQCARTLPRHTMRREGDGFSLSFPFDPRAPFPLVPAFCFARAEGGRLIFSFQKGGVPYISSQAGHDKGGPNEQRRENHGKSDHQGAARSGGPAGV